MSKTYSDLLQEVKATVRQLSLEDLKGRMDAGEALVLLDVREKDEWRQGHIPGALHIPRGFLEMQAESRIADKATPIVTICAGGIRSAFAAKVL
ncbi:MAG: rhodanese-like domain-containing protein, partial [Myxococcales bacterium]|nr:rhodanese-like domain-containing protein [Myxococcales bacterium]